jgi:hypothetical protein
MTPSATVKQVAASQLLGSFYKKYVDRTNPDADELALLKFESINRNCGNWVPLCETWEDELIGCLRKEIYDFLYPSGMPLLTDYVQIFEHGRVGPGASVGAKGYDFYTKLFSSPLSATSTSLYKMYENYVSNYPLWRDAENHRKAQYGECDVVAGSRLHFVPKTVDISRLICVEPSLNMFGQLGIGAILERRLDRYFGIDLSVQPDISRELAKLGSMRDDDESFVTIDLASASDSLSMKMLENVLPRDFFSWLKLFRSPSTEVHGRQVELNMVSTMGNGFTFPLQTMLFACVVRAAAFHRGIRLRKKSPSSLPNFSVFGDDIVCQRRIASDVLRLLRYLGFTVNSSKSFILGPFRESCGRDYYFGHDVRGVYVRSLKTQQDRYAVINALNLWSAKVGISLPNTVRYLMSSVKNQPVPAEDNVDAGIRTPYSFVAKKKRDGNQACIYYASVSRPLFIAIGEDRFVYPRAVRQRRDYNPFGLLVALLQGCVQSGKISVRHDWYSYRTKRRVTPRWDYLPPSSDIASLTSWKRWETAFYLNTY